MQSYTSTVIFDRDGTACFELCLILYFQKSSNDFHPSTCICMMPIPPIIFAALILHWLGQKGYPGSSSLFDFREAN